MGEGDSKKRRRRRIGLEARVAFLAAVRGGMRVKGAALLVGHSEPGFYGLRARDPAFAAEFAEALAQSAEAERPNSIVDNPGLGENGERCPHCGALRETIAPNNGRQLQRRKMRRVRFTEARQEIFLSHFAATCDTKAAAEAAGVDETTVYKHRLKNPAFAARYQEALDLGYPRLEAEALRQRLEAQTKLRGEIMPIGEISAEFERVMKLLSRWDRKNGRPGPRSIAPGRQQSWTFDEAIALIEKKLKNFGVPIPDEPEEDIRE